MLSSRYCNSAIYLSCHFKEVTSLHGIGHEDKMTSEWITPLVKHEKVLHHENNAKYHQSVRNESPYLIEEHSTALTLRATDRV